MLVEPTMYTNENLQVETLQVPTKLVTKDKYSYRVSPQPDKVIALPELRSEPWWTVDCIPRSGGHPLAFINILALLVPLLQGPVIPLNSIPVMVLILDGCSFHVAHV